MFFCCCYITDFNQINDDALENENTIELIESKKIGEHYHCVCNRKFKHRSQFRYHFNNECGRKFKCTYCKFMYNSIAARHQHIFRCHKKLWINLKKIGKL